MEYIWDYLNGKTYNSRVGHYKFKREFDFIIKNGINNFDKILDIAGGSGRFALPLKKYSTKITVLDINQTALEILKKRDNEVNTICSDFIKSKFQETFSLIICIEAIEYFDNWVEFFNKISLLLNDDGVFIFTFANPNSWRYFLRKIKHWKNGPTRYNETTLKELTEILNKCNFEIEKMEGMNWIPLSLSSNSKLVLIFEYIEKKIKLKNWHSQSPWLMISVKKSLIVNH